MMSKKDLCSIGSAGDRKGVYPAVARLLHTPFAHERRVVGGVEAVYAVVVAFAGDHPVHRRKIPVRANARSAPIRESLSRRRFVYKPVFQKPFCKRAFRFGRQIGLSVADGQKLEFFRLQPPGVSLAFYVIGAGNECPGAQGDIFIENILHFFAAFRSDFLPRVRKRTLPAGSGRLRQALTRSALVRMNVLQGRAQCSAEFPFAAFAAAAPVRLS